jgi:hypothetical protein
MMDKVLKDKAKWLQILWTVGVENCVETALVIKCIKLCEHTISELYDTGSQ